MPQDPPRVPKRPEPAITRLRPRLESHDDADAVRAADDANLREGQLLARLATEQQLRVAAEALAKTLQDEAQARAEAAQARARQAQVIIQTPPAVQSVPPPGEALRIREVRIGDLKGWVALLAGFTALVIGILGYVRPEPPPKVIDNAATVSTLQAELSRMALELATVKEVVRAGEDWNANGFKSLGAEFSRTTGARALPALSATPLGMKKVKPVVRLETPQPTLQ